MAILQISRITNRKGYEENLPQLAGAEFGWALDGRRLFIGNGTIDDGAPVIGNTEILTEFSNLLELSSTYTYKGAEGGYIVSTGDDDVIRSMQGKLDDTVSVRAFGAVGDGVVDDTDAINLALNQLFCNPINQSTKIRRSLFFPAGTYRTTNVIKVPPYAKLYGEGLDSSIIEYKKDHIIATDITVGEEYTIVSVGDSSNETDFTLIGATDNNTGTVFTATNAGTGSGTVTFTLSIQFVVQTSDSLQQIGDDLGNANQGVTPSIPEGIEMSSMSINSTEKNSLLLINSLTKSSFSFMSFSAIMTEIDLGDKETNNTASIRIVRTGNFTPGDITFNKCLTKGTTVGLDINDKCKGVQFENGKLEMHYQGVCLGGDNLINYPMPMPSPTGVNISRSIFDMISDAGILFGDVKFNSSAFNVFYNVGNTFEEPPLSEIADPSAIISMHNGDNVSIGDLFERSDEDAEKSPRIELNNQPAIAFDSTSAMFLGTYKRKVGLESIITPADGVTDVFTLKSPESSTFQVDYSMTRGNDVRTGSTKFVTYIEPDTAQPDLPATQIHYSLYEDNYTETNDLSTTFSVRVDLNEDDIPTGTTLSLDPGMTLTDDVNFKYSVLRLN